MCVPLLVCVCVFWLWFRRDLFSAFEEVQEGEDVFGNSLGWLWLPCRGYLGHILCVGTCLLRVMAQLELCVCLHELTPLLPHVKLPACPLPSCICVWEWWELYLMPSTLYFCEIHASGWVEWPYFGRGYGKMASKTVRNTERLFVWLRLVLVCFGVFFLTLKESPVRGKLWSVTSRGYVEHYRWSKLGFLPRWIKKGEKPRRCADLLQVQ